MNAADVRINARTSGYGGARFETLLKHRRPSTSKLLVDFVGAGEGPEDLSACYKRYSGEGLAGKLHGYVQDADQNSKSSAAHR